MADLESNSQDTDLKSFGKYVNDLTEKYSRKKSLAEKNRSVFGNWPDESDFAILDSSLKKNTAFVKKIRGFNENKQKENILREVHTLNLTKYIGEISSALFEAKLKLAELPFLLEFVSQVHQKYFEFHKTFYVGWKKYLPTWKDNSEPSNYIRYRTDLIIFAELTSIHIFEENDGLKLLSAQLSCLINSDKANLAHISVVNQFCKYCGDDWAGLIPYPFKKISEETGRSIPQSDFLPPDKQTKLKGLLLEYYSCVCQRLHELVKTAKHLTKVNKKQFENRGELREENKLRAEQLSLDCRKLHESFQALSEVLGEEPPQSLDEILKDLEQTEEDLDEALVQENDQTDTLNTLLFDDEETRQFYESLPDIKLMVPAVCFLHL
ncbi:Regulator of nonsense transcripts upf2 [Cichlidogyrus casuarinus]|uniref:Regulator of nonsense transcripts upf2 n=1 Tax=Cichlidogyrus casuarinus TaxID=1844966 RepID=A0ABD2QG64_9PLAT